MKRTLLVLQILHSSQLSELSHRVFTTSGQAIFPIFCKSYFFDSHFLDMTNVIVFKKPFTEKHLRF